MKQRGFTLIELMVTVAVIGILAAIAYPSYQSFVRKTRLAQAKEAAMHVSTELERRLAQSNAYETSIAGMKEYEDMLDFSYATKNNDRDYVLKVSEKTPRFGIRVMINSRGTHCALADKSAAAPVFDEKASVCPTPAEAF